MIKKQMDTSHPSLDTPQCSSVDWYMGEMCSIQSYVIMFVSDLRQVGGVLNTILRDTVCQ